MHDVMSDRVSLRTKEFIFDCLIRKLKYLTIFLIINIYVFNLPTCR